MPRSWTNLCCALLAAAPLAAASHAQVPEPHASDRVPPGVKLSDEQSARLGVRAVFTQRRQVGPPREVIYGPDDRLDRYQVSSSTMRSLGDSVCSVTTASNIASNGDGTYRLLDTGRFTEVLGNTLCSDERFRGQVTLGYCTAFLVGSDLVATAGHCISAADAVFIFGFDQLGPGLAGPPDEFDPLHIPEANVYFATSIVDRQFSTTTDYAVVKLDRKVEGREPLAIRRTGQPASGQELLVIGHGNNLPSKYDAGGVVQDANPGVPYFTANLDAFGGNSGSPVMNRATGVVEGILVRGNADFEVSGGCVRSRVCADGGCPGFEEITRSSVFADAIPRAGVAVSPLGVTTSIGPVGGPFSNASVTYTLTNAAADAANFSVSLDAGGSCPLLINNALGPIAGTLPAGGSTSIVVSLAPAAATLGAGSYASVVRFADSTHNVLSTRTHKLEVGTSGFEVAPAGSAALSGQPGGPFVGAKFYTITSTRATPVQVRVQGDASWIAIDGGDSQTFTLPSLGASRTIVVGASSAASSLGAGVYSGNVLFANLTGGEGSTSRLATLEVGRVNYSSSGPAVAIPDRGVGVSGVLVNENWCVGDVNVSVDLAHGYVGDLIVDLTSPAGTTVRLKNRSGGDQVNFVGTFDQDSAIIPDGPGSLDDFDGSAASGVWLLRVTDNATGQAGVINGWTLSLVPAAGCAPIAMGQDVRVPATLTTSLGLQATSFSQTPASFRITRLPAHGTLFDPEGGAISQTPYDVQLNGVEVRYRPELGFAGEDGFEYVAVENQNAGPAAEVNLLVGADREVARFTFATDPGWTREGGWAYGTPLGGGSGNKDPMAGFTGVSVMGFNLAGDYPNAMSAAQYLTTGAVDCSTIAAPRVEFRCWLGVERNAFDRATVQVSVDGGASWSAAWINPDDTLSDASWLLQSVALGANAGGKPDVRIRWGMGPTDALVALPGWNLDDVRVVGVAAPSPACKIDLNLDSAVDLEDFFAFFNALDQGLVEGDVNGDGRIDDADFFAFFEAWDGSGCN